MAGALTVQPQGVCYGINDVLGQISYGKYDGVSPNSYQSPVYSTQLIQSPSNTSLVLESTSPIGGPWVYHLYGGLMPHDGATSVLFADAHATSIPYPDIPAAVASNWRPAKSVIDQLDTFWNGQR